MWLLFAFSSAIFAGITAILAKIGVKNTDSNVATAVRTIIILIFSCIMTYITKGYESQVTVKSFIFLVLSGLATGLSWLCYFKALQLGDINKITPIDKSSTILTMILSFILLGEQVTVTKVMGICLIGIGTYLMIEKKEKDTKKNIRNSWFIYAAFSAIFAALTAILGKIGITGIESNYGTTIRTVIVLIMAWVLVFVSNKQDEIRHIDKKIFVFLCLSGITTGLSWLSLYKALQDGEAGIVVAIDKLSILFTIGFSYVVFREKLYFKSFVGLAGIVAGTLILLIK